jgi:Serine dehydrogenase proteinase
MNKTQRLDAIRQLEQLRSSRVIIYLTADRGVASTPMSEDVLRITYDHLRSMGKTEQIDLFIYSRGGDTMLPWPLVNTIRSFCDRFCVLVPFRAHSAATLTSLGANEIVMTPVAELTPVEPTITMALNPEDPKNRPQPLGVNVEDVSTYMKFVKDRAEIESEAGRMQALAALTSQMHPVALGHLHRFHLLAERQAKKLLELHMDHEKHHAEIEDIVKKLITTLWAHNYKINRNEAREIGLKAVDPSAEVDAAIWSLFEGYEEYMALRQPILASASTFPQGQSQVALTNNRMSVVESTEQSDVFAMDLELTRPVAPTAPGMPAQFGPQVQVVITRQAWRKG